MQQQTDEIVAARGLSAGYGTNTVWSNATFSVERGEFIGLLGANGAGKTTLFKLLLGLEKPKAGELLVLGRQPKRGSPHIGYVPQRRPIDTESRIAAIEYVRLGLSGHRWGFSLPRHVDAEYEQALEALGRVDASDLAHRPLKVLSGGELQRIFLAQALIGKPDLLLLDEPLANLDIRREVQLIKLTQQVVRKDKIAAILIAHDINPLLTAISRIIYIANRSVVAGRPDEIVTSKTLSALYNAPIEVLRDSKGRMAVLGVEEALHHEG
jgi:zinc/manganese transport system ATP-binding protein